MIYINKFDTTLVTYRVVFIWLTKLFGYDKMLIEYIGIGIY